MTSARRIPVAGPWITAREIEYVSAAVATNWYERAGEFQARFETAFATQAGRKHALALSSCTGAIHLALASLGVGPGTEVIVPELTWIASAAPITYLGANPVFVDVDESTWCIDVGSVEAALTSRTKAVIAVDLYGGLPRMDELEELLARHGVPLVEDAAEAVGGAFGGRPAGSFGAVSTFSFHGSKTLTTGEGGMLVTDDRDLYERCASLADHARTPGQSTFRRAEVGFKYKMSSMQAALGLAQLERLDELMTRKRQIFGWYRERLEREGELLTLNVEPSGVTNSYWMITAILAADRGLTKDMIGAELRERGIDTRPFFDPLSSLEAYREHRGSQLAAAANVISYRLAPYGLNLPSALSLTEDDVEYVCQELLKLLKKSRGRSVLAVPG